MFFPNIRLRPASATTILVGWWWLFTPLTYEVGGVCYERPPLTKYPEFNLVGWIELWPHEDELPLSPRRFP